MNSNLYSENDPIEALLLSKNHLTIYEITKRALFSQFLMNHNEDFGNMICEKCMVTWENYYDYLSKYFDEVIPNWIEENSLV